MYVWKCFFNSSIELNTPNALSHSGDTDTGFAVVMQPQSCLNIFPVTIFFSVFKINVPTLAVLHDFLHRMHKVREDCILVFDSFWNFFMN